MFDFYWKKLEEISKQVVCIMSELKDVMRRIKHVHIWIKKIRSEIEELRNYFMASLEKKVAELSAKLLFGFEEIMIKYFAPLNARFDDIDKRLSVVEYRVRELQAYQEKA